MSNDKREMVDNTVALLHKTKMELLIMRALFFAEENGMDFKNVTNVRTYAKDMFKTL